MQNVSGQKRYGLPGNMFEKERPAVWRSTGWFGLEIDSNGFPNRGECGRLKPKPTTMLHHLKFQMTPIQNQKTPWWKNYRGILLPTTPTRNSDVLAYMRANFEPVSGLQFPRTDLRWARWWYNIRICEHLQYTSYICLRFCCRSFTLTCKFPI